MKAFLEARRAARTRYVALLSCLEARPIRWSRLKRCIRAGLGVRLANSQIYRYLNKLQGYGFIEKNNGSYMPADPYWGSPVTHTNAYTSIRPYRVGL